MSSGRGRGDEFYAFYTHLLNGGLALHIPDKLPDSSRLGEAAQV
jgi:hypothetical protein